TITFIVADTGIGMSEEQLGRVFEAFGQAEAGTSRRYGGTGVGLPISRQVCRLMGGDITVRSELGRGATFVLWLPVRVSDGYPVACFPKHRGAMMAHGRPRTLRVLMVSLEKGGPR